ncbi:MAG: HD domain-containing protein [Methanobacteriota archaeon]|nr:MAG: HD domain-containing protein [Euryarchaeota archaeon]
MDTSILVKDMPEHVHSFIRSAYELAKEKHAHMVRKGSGDPYILHPFRTALLLHPLKDYQLVCAALLHDVVEDTDVTIDEIKSKFGIQIAFLVEGCTKDTDGSDPIAKVLDFAKKDHRVLLLKIADRTDNMRDHPSLMDERLREKYIVQGRRLLDACNKLNLEYLIDEFSRALAQLMS